MTTTNRTQAAADFEDSMEFTSNTIAGIIERADVLTGSGGSLDQFRAEVKRLTEESLENTESL